MKKFQILTLFLCVLVVSQSWIQAETNKDEDALKKQIKELKNQVEMLKKRIITLEKQLQAIAHRSVAIPKSFPKLQKIPEGWKEYEFNGMKYYIIPIQTESKKTNPPKK
jgi:septal ring factor EnvC (AmiA/AmiB activator)